MNRKPPFENGATAYVVWGTQSILKATIKFCRRRPRCDFYEVNADFTDVNGKTFNAYVMEHYVFTSAKDALKALIKGNNQEIASYQEKLKRLQDANDYLMSANFQMRYIGEIINVED